MPDPLNSVAEQIRGDHLNADYNPEVIATGKSLKSGYYLSKLLTEAGWQVLEKNKTGTVSGNGWTVYSRIDHDGHDRGWKLTRYLPEILKEIKERILELLQAGWQKVRVVTDHGWLLFPGGLPRIDLPAALTENKWGRCAVIKPGALHDENLYPWYWNPGQQVALAPGVYCYKSGQEYAHGGLSFQECLTLELIISRDAEAVGFPRIKITETRWHGFRCNVVIEGDYSGLSLDIRTHPGNPVSSTVMKIKPIKENGRSFVVVENEEYEGAQAYIVIIDKTQQPVAQVATIIGE